MGKSFTEFRGHGFWVKDWPLEVWLCLVTLNLRNPYGLHNEAFETLRYTWLFAATVGGTGCVGNFAALDRVLVNDDLVDLAIKASERTLEGIRALGPKLDHRYLNLLGTAGSTFIGEIDSWSVVQVGEHFLRLLRGELAWEPRTSPVLPTKAPETRDGDSPAF